MEAGNRRSRMDGSGPDNNISIDAASRLRAALQRYIDVIARSASETHRAEDRPRYQQHLAAGALLFAAIERGDAEGFAKIITSEEHSYGWDYLSDECGRRADSAFHEFHACAKGSISLQ